MGSISARNVVMLDHTQQRTELLGLERRAGFGGRERVDHPALANCHDDAINSLAGAAVLTAGRRPPLKITAATLERARVRPRRRPAGAAPGERQHSRRPAAAPVQVPRRDQPPAQSRRDAVLGGRQLPSAKSPMRGTSMPTPLSPTARELAGCLWTFLTPRLAQDQSVADLNLSAILSGVTHANFSSQISAITRRVKAVTRRRLALDADLDDLPNMLDDFAEKREQGDQEPEGTRRRELRASLPRDLDAVRQARRPGPRVGTREHARDGRKRRPPLPGRAARRRAAGPPPSVRARRRAVPGPARLRTPLPQQ